MLNQIALHQSSHGNFKEFIYRLIGCVLLPSLPSVSSLFHPVGCGWMQSDVSQMLYYTYNHTQK